MKLPMLFICLWHRFDIFVAVIVITWLLGLSFCCSSTLNTVLTHWCKIPHSSFTGGFWSETSSTHADEKKTLSLQKANIQMALNKLDFTMQCLDLTKMINKCWKDDPETWKVKVLQFTYCEYSRVPLGPWDVNLFFVCGHLLCAILWRDITMHRVSWSGL